MDNLSKIYWKAKRIHSSNMSQDGKDVAYANLMTVMEQQYGIPLFRNTEWERKHPDIIRVYREISNMRNI